MQVIDKHADGTSAIQVGERVKFNYSPVKSDGSPGFEAKDSVTALSNNQGIASVEPNPEIGNNSGSIITMLAAGTVTITVAAQNENGVPYHSDFQVVVSAPVLPVTDHFQVIVAN